MVPSIREARARAVRTFLSKASRRQEQNFYGQRPGPEFGISRLLETKYRKSRVEKAVPTRSVLTKSLGSEIDGTAWWRTQSHVEPVSTPKFPANREKNREFRQICLLRAISKADTRANSKAFSQIPYATEQGIISEEQGILAPEQGICLPKTEIVAG